MASPIDAQLILADSAQADGGKVHMLGAGWSVTTTPTAPSAVVGLIKVPWDRANQRLTMVIDLVDEDGQLVELPAQTGAVVQNLEFRGQLEVGRPPGLKPGTPIDSSFAIGIGSLPLTPGRYAWRLQLDDTVVTAAFQVMGQPKPYVAPA